MRAILLAIATAAILDVRRSSSFTNHGRFVSPERTERALSGGASGEGLGGTRTATVTRPAPAPTEQATPTTTPHQADQPTQEDEL